MLFLYLILSFSAGNTAVGSAVMWALKFKFECLKINSAWKIVPSLNSEFVVTGLTALHAVNGKRVYWWNASFWWVTMIVPAPR